MMGGDQVSGVSARMMPNGPGAAAVLAAGIGCFAMGAVSVVADKLPALARLLNIYRPTGPLSGVSTVAIVVWLAAWAVLHYYWKRAQRRLAAHERGLRFLLAGMRRAADVSAGRRFASRARRRRNRAAVAARVPAISSGYSDSVQSRSST